MWSKSKDKFGFIKASGPSANRIDIAKAKGPMAYQVKLFAGINYKLVRPERVWNISLNSDATAASIGIGRDFSITLNVETHF